jgi:pilus assembly protein CpaF
VIVQLARFADGSRRMIEVTAVTSRRREDFAFEPLMTFEPDPMAANRVVTGRFVNHRLPADLLDRLIVRGETVPAAFLDAAS